MKMNTPTPVYFRQELMTDLVKTSIVAWYSSGVVSTASFTLSGLSHQRFYEKKSRCSLVKFIAASMKD